MAVSTRCFLPEKKVKNSLASSSVLAFPKILLLQITIVSAERIVFSGNFLKTNSPFSFASLLQYSIGFSFFLGVSSISAGSTTLWNNIDFF